MLRQDSDTLNYRSECVRAVEQLTFRRSRSVPNRDSGARGRTAENHFGARSAARRGYRPLATARWTVNGSVVACAARATRDSVRRSRQGLFGEAKVTRAGYSAGGNGVRLRPVSTEATAADKRELGTRRVIDRDGDGCGRHEAHACGPDAGRLEVSAARTGCDASRHSESAKIRIDPPAVRTYSTFPAEIQL